MIQKFLYATTTVCLLLLGGLLVWASNSWYALVWTQARAAFPDEGTRVLMVNTDLSRRAKYLPEEFQNNIAICAVIVDRRDQVLAVAYREPWLTPYPEGKRRLDTRYYFMRAHAWSEAGRVVGAIVLVLAMVQGVAFLADWLAYRKTKQR